MAQTKYTCKDCVLLNDEDLEFPYCIGKDLYTYTNPDDDACGDLFRWYILARIVSSSRMGFAIIPRRRDTHRKKILHVEISSTKRL